MSKFRIRVPRLWGKCVLKNESCWAINANNNYTKFCCNAITDRDCLLPTNAIWPMPNDDDKMIDDWLEDCYNEWYFPSSVYEFRVRNFLGKCWAVNVVGYCLKHVRAPASILEIVRRMYSENESYWAIDVNKQIRMRTTVAYNHENS